MSDISLPTLGDPGNSSSLSKSRFPMQEINSAYKECKFGLFHIKLLSTACIAFIAGVLVSNSTSYLLPSAECDLHMSLLQKGVLNAMPYVGMLLSSLVAGFMTDAFGRKMFVVGGNFGIFIFLLIAATSQTYEVLLFAKFFEGMMFAAAFSATLTLTSEFCHDGIRDRILLCQSSFAALGQILVPAMAWGILTHDWKYELFGGVIVLNTWNIYLYIMSLWSLATVILYTFLIPESPKFLITKNKYDEAREILIKIYTQNTWKAAETYPYYNIWKDKTKHTLKEEPESELERSFRHQIMVGLHNIKPMFQKPLLGRLILICSLNFLIMALYNIVRLWFPQLSTIVEHYKVDDSQDLCEMLDTYTSELKLKALNRTDADICIPTKSGAETYINSIILGCVCVFPYFITGVLINRVGKKRLHLALGLMVCGTMLGIRWANTKPAIVILFSLTTAISQVLLGLDQAFIVENFNTSTRTLAISFIMMFGRIGTLVGNVTFPALLEMRCVIPFYGMTGMMVCVVGLATMLPTKRT